MPEGVRDKIDAKRIGRNVKQARKIFSRLKYLAGKRFTVRHILVRLDPFSRRDLPSAFFYPRLYLVKHIRAEFFDYLVCRCLRLRKGEVRILRHHVKHRSECIDCYSRSLVVAPHPVHVDMSVRNEERGIALHRPGKRSKHCLGFGNRSICHRAVFRNITDDKVRRTLYLPVIPPAVSRRNPVKTDYLGAYALRCAALSLSVSYPSHFFRVIHGFPPFVFLSAKRTISPPPSGQTAAKKNLRMILSCYP